MNRGIEANLHLLVEGDISADLGKIKALFVDGAKDVIPAPEVTCEAYQGGGGRGCVYLGMDKANQDCGIDPYAVAGSSIGAMTAFARALGFQGEQFEALVKALKFDDLSDVPLPSSGEILKSALSGLGMVTNAIRKGFATSGQPIHDWAQMLCQATLSKANATFEDLINAKANAPEAFKDLIITGTIKLGDKAETILFKYTPPEEIQVMKARGQHAQAKRAKMINQVSIADALQASVAIPGVFEPKVIHTQEEKSQYVGIFFDGGCFNNFPIDTLDRRKYATTKLGIEYPLAYYQVGETQKHVNPCSQGWSFVDSLENYITDVTPAPKIILDKAKALNIDLTQNQLDSSRVKPSRHASFKDAMSMIKRTTHGRLRYEDLHTKYEMHPNHINLMYANDISLLDCDVSDEKMATGVQMVYDAAIEQAKRRDDHNQSHDGQDIKIHPKSLSEYLVLYYDELKKYQQELVGYNAKFIEDNTRLQFLAHRINLILKTSQDPQNQLKEALLQFRQALNTRQQQNLAHQAKCHIVLDESALLSNLATLLMDGKIDAFKALLKGQLSKAKALITKPIHSQNQRNLLTIAFELGKLDEALWMITHMNIDLGFKDANGLTILHHLARKGDIDTIVMLFEQGYAKPCLANQNDDHGRNIFNLLAKHIPQDKQAQQHFNECLFKLLTLEGSPKRASLFTPDHYGVTAMHYILLSEHGAQCIDSLTSSTTSGIFGLLSYTYRLMEFANFFIPKSKGIPLANGKSLFEFCCDINPNLANLLLQKIAVEEIKASTGKGAKGMTPTFALSVHCSKDQDNQRTYNIALKQRVKVQ